MTTRDFVAYLRDELRSKLEGKSAWGKQQVLMLVETAMTDVLLTALPQDDRDEE